MHPQQSPHFQALWESDSGAGTWVLFILLHVRDHSTWLEADPKPAWMAWAEASALAFLIVCEKHRLCL